MNNNIDNFIWENQYHFWISVKISAELLFEKLDNKLKPEVFLIGVLIDNNENKSRICFEPKDCGYSVDIFSDINKLAQELEKVDEEKNIFHSDEIVHYKHLVSIHKKSYMNAINKILKSEYIYTDSDIFVSYPVNIEGYLVFTVLKLQKQIINKYYALNKNKFNNMFTIQRSLIESAIYIYLNECSESLNNPYKGLDSIKRQAEELMIDIGRQFMYTISQVGNNHYGLHGLYESCNQISSLKYEGKEGMGKIVIAKKQHPNIRLILELKEPICINNFRKVRKFLEIVDNNNLIISDSYFIYGLGEIKGKYNPRDESLFIINFIDFFKWEVLHDNNPMMLVEFKQPSLPKEKVDKEKFYRDIKRIFNDIHKKQIDDLWDIIIEVTEKKHGTIIVISDNAEKESARLGKQCFQLHPIKITPNLLHQFTSIDGAVLLDRDSYCFAIGVILDGIASEKGDSSRGARYNSAIRYYEYFGKSSPSFIVIISDDGMINLIPDLKPQIYHSLIIDNIKLLKNININENDGSKKFNKIMKFFEEHEFYLKKEECDLINQLRIKIENEDDNKDKVGILRMIRNDLIPNDEMNDSYYFDQ